MGASDILRLLLLAAIWGGSFVFLRVVAPAFGPIVTADLRVLIAGVGLVTGVAPDAGGSSSQWAMAACLLAAASYGFVSVYAKRFAAAANSRAIAAGSQLMAGLLLLPLALVMPPPGPVTLFVAVSMILFALLSSGVAFLLYFRLIADIGPTKALTVTFLMPAFTMIWAGLFISEKITVVMVAGCVLILAGTALVVVRK